MKDCLSIICGLWRISTGISSSLESPDKTVSSKNGNIAAEIALLEAGINTCSAMQKLLAMVFFSRSFLFHVRVSNLKKVSFLLLVDYGARYVKEESRYARIDY